MNSFKRMNMRLMKSNKNNENYYIYLSWNSCEHLKMLQCGNNENMNYMLIATNTWKNFNCITVKELHVTLKNALKKIEVLGLRNKLGIENFDKDKITRFRSNCKNSKLRNIYFRLIHNDFFTHVRMKKYKMTQMVHRCLRNKEDLRKINKNFEKSKCDFNFTNCVNCSG